MGYVSTIVRETAFQGPGMGPQPYYMRHLWAEAYVWEDVFYLQVEVTYYIPRTGRMHSP